MPSEAGCQTICFTETGVCYRVHSWAQQKIINHDAKRHRAAKRVPVGPLQVG